jgi:hypothetical protein
MWEHSYDLIHSHQQQSGWIAKFSLSLFGQNAEILEGCLLKTVYTFITTVYKVYMHMHKQKQVML